MQINVKPELLALIQEVEQDELSRAPKTTFSWAFFESGRVATGVAVGNSIYYEYDLSITEDGTKYAYRNPIDKWHFDCMETMPMSADYESDEE